MLSDEIRPGPTTIQCSVTSAYRSMRRRFDSITIAMLADLPASQSKTSKTREDGVSGTEEQAEIAE